MATLFARHGQQFQALSAQAAAFHSQFVQALNSAGSAYTAAEAAGASPLQAVVQGAQSLAVFSPVAAATGRSLIGNGARFIAWSKDPAKHIYPYECDPSFALEYQGVKTGQ